MLQESESMTMQSAAETHRKRNAVAASRGVCNDESELVQWDIDREKVKNTTLLIESNMRQGAQTELGQHDRGLADDLMEIGIGADIHSLVDINGCRRCETFKSR